MRRHHDGFGAVEFVGAGFGCGLVEPVLGSGLLEPVLGSGLVEAVLGDISLS